MVTVTGLVVSKPSVNTLPIGSGEVLGPNPVPRAPPEPIPEPPEPTPGPPEPRPEPLEPYPGLLEPIPEPAEPSPARRPGCERLSMRRLLMS